MIDFRSFHVEFDKDNGETRHKTVSVVFPSRVNRVDAAINGFEIGYSDGDHHLLRARVNTSPSINDRNHNVVDVVVAFSLRDSSGNFDDRYNGFVDVLVIVDRE